MDSFWEMDVDKRDGLWFGASLFITLKLLLRVKAIDCGMSGWWSRCVTILVGREKDAGCNGNGYVAIKHAVRLL